MGFNLADVLSDVSNLDTNREQIEYIKLDLIDVDPNNFYQLSGVEDLAANIQLCGLQQPIRLRKHPAEDGRYMIVSGHRRREAILLLAKDDPDKWEEVPCIIEADEVPAALQQLRLIYANSNTRTMTSAELSEQAVQVEKLLYQLKEEGYEFPGRMRDHVAKAVNASKTKLARLKMIRDHLAECWVVLYKKNELTEDAAYKLAQLPIERQTLIYDIRDKKGNVQHIYAGDVSTYSDRFESIDSLNCAKGKKLPCQNIEGKCKEAVYMDRYGYFQCGYCCSKCSKLVSCRYACPKLADKIKKLRAEKKADKTKVQAEREAREQPTVDFIRGVYDRFGKAREIAGLSVEDVYKFQKKFFVPKYEEEHIALEDGSAKVTPDTQLPFGYSFGVTYAKRLCETADAFGCSIDYLLGRTDVREVVQAATAVPEVDTIWHPISEEPPTGVDLVWLDARGYSDTAEYKGGGKISIVSTIPWEEARYWAYLPKEEE